MFSGIIYQIFQRTGQFFCVCHDPARLRTGLIDKIRSAHLDDRSAAIVKLREKLIQIQGFHTRWGPCFRCQHLDRVQPLGQKFALFFDIRHFIPGSLVEHDIVAAYDLRHIGQGGERRFHIMSEFGDQLAPLGEELVQVECFFRHLFLQMERQPFIFGNDIIILLHHPDGKGDHHAIYAILLRPSQGGRFKVADCQDAIEKEGAVCRDSSQRHGYMGTPVQTAAEGCAGQKYGCCDLVPRDQDTVPLRECRESGEEDQRQNGRGTAHSKRENTDDCVEPAVLS